LIAIEQARNADSELARSSRDFFEAAKVLSLDKKAIPQTGGYPSLTTVSLMAQSCELSLKSILTLHRVPDLKKYGHDLLKLWATCAIHEAKNGTEFHEIPVLDLVLLSDVHQGNYLRYDCLTEFELLPSVAGMFVLAEAFLHLYERRLGETK